MLLHVKQKYISKYFKEDSVLMRLDSVEDMFIMALQRSRGNAELVLCINQTSSLLFINNIAPAAACSNVIKIYPDFIWQEKIMNYIWKAKYTKITLIGWGREDK